MSPEQEAEYRQLALQVVDVFGEPLFDGLFAALGGHKKLLDVAANTMWLGMRGEVMKFPIELLQYLKPHSGADRLKKLVLAVAPKYIVSAPIENIQKVVDEMFPIVDKLESIRKLGDKDACKAQS